MKPRLPKDYEEKQPVPLAAVVAIVFLLIAVPCCVGKVAFDNTEAQRTIIR